MGGGKYWFLKGALRVRLAMCVCDATGDTFFVRWNFFS